MNEEIPTQICDWHDQGYERIPSFATVIIDSGGPVDWKPICKQCLIGVIKLEIESIEGRYYEGADPTRLPIERKVLRALENEVC